MGEKTGQKASADQVAKDMRNARTHDNLRFAREEWLKNCKAKDSFLVWHLREESTVGTGLTQAKRITKVTKLESNALLLKR